MGKQGEKLKLKAETKSWGSSLVIAVNHFTQKVLGQQGKSLKLKQKRKVYEPRTR